MLGCMFETATEYLCFAIGAIVAQIVLRSIELNPIEIIFTLNCFNRFGRA